MCDLNTPRRPLLSATFLRATAPPPGRRAAAAASLVGRYTCLHSSFVAGPHTNRGLCSQRALRPPLPFRRNDLPGRPRGLGRASSSAIAVTPSSSSSSPSSPARYAAPFSPLLPEGGGDTDEEDAAAVSAAAAALLLGEGCSIIALADGGTSTGEQRPKYMLNTCKIYEKYANNMH